MSNGADIPIARKWKPKLWLFVAQYHLIQSALGVQHTVVPMCIQVAKKISEARVRNIVTTSRYS